jgi:hypothetical protein
VVIYGLPVHFGMVFLAAKDIALYIIMCFPVIFLFGVLPQSGTFIFVLFEQIHMHMFGGSGVISLSGSILQLFSAMITVGVLIGVGYTSAYNASWVVDYHSAVYR